MQPARPFRRTSFLVLCAGLFVIFPLVGARAFRVPVVHEIVGIVLFAVVVLCAWLLSRPPAETAARRDPRVRLAGGLLVTPFALIALLWVGLGTPWDATPPENEMRYAVLVVGAVAIMCGFFLVREALQDGGELLWSTLGLALSLLAGAAFVVWASFQMGFHALVAAQGEAVAAVAVNNVFDALLFVAGALAYVTTAVFARALGEAGWLGRKTALVYVGLNVLALGLLALRGVSFPSPSASPEPWYTRPASSSASRRCRGSRPTCSASCCCGARAKENPSLNYS